MSALGLWAENSVVNYLLRGVAPTVPSAWYIALYTSNPTYLDVGTEVSFTGGTNYSRMPITFSAPSSGSLSNTGEIDFPIAGQIWGNITYAAIRDDPTTGHLLFYGALVVPRYIGQGDQLKFLVGNVVCMVS